MEAEAQLEIAGSVMKNYPTPRSGSHRGEGVSSPTTWQWSPNVEVVKLKQWRRELRAGISWCLPTAQVAWQNIEQPWVRI
eukprot:3885230-Amphidinium_carterae.1